MLVAFKGISVQAAEALSSAFVVGYPGLTRINGTVHTIRRKLLSHTGISLKIKGFMVLHHGGQVRLHGKYRDRLTQKRAVYNGSIRPSKDRADIYFTPPMISRPLLDLTLSLILDCDTAGAKLLEQAIIEDPELLALITQPNGFGGRVAGCAGVVTASSLPEILRCLPSGRFLADRTDLLSQDGKDSLEAMLDILEEKTPGVNPLQVGYRLLETPSRKMTARAEAEHAFAEPITGLVAFVPKAVVTTSAGRSEKIYFTSTVDIANRLCVVSGAAVPEILLPIALSSELEITS